MEIKFDSEEGMKPRRNIATKKLNFLARGILRLGITKDKKMAQVWSLVISVILIIWCIFAVISNFSEEPIDEKYYYIYD